MAFNNATNVIVGTTNIVNKMKNIKAPYFIEIANAYIIYIIANITDAIIVYNSIYPSNINDFSKYTENLFTFPKIDP